MIKRNHTVLTLDAGGTNFNFMIIENGERVGETIQKPSHSNNLELCIQTIKSGFTELIETLPSKPDSISFAFPGPGDYKNGVIGDLPNLTAFRGGVPLGPILENEFKIPVFINNDGDLYALGESNFGFLPTINTKLKEIGNPKRYKNIIGITLGTGFGVGISINGALLEGDNGAASEGWLLRNKHYPYSSIEDTISGKAIKRMYAEQIYIDPIKSPEPIDIYKIAVGEKEGVREAALETYLRYGEVLGDGIAHILTLIDGVVVIGGGISGAYPLFSKSMLDELNGYYTGLNGKKYKRLIQKVYNFESEWERKEFLSNDFKEIVVEGSNEKIPYFDIKKTIIGLTKKGASEMISLGAFYYSYSQIN